MQEVVLPIKLSKIANFQLTEADLASIWLEFRQQFNSAFRTSLTDVGYFYGFSENDSILSLPENLSGCPKGF